MPFDFSDPECDSAPRMKVQLTLERHRVAACLWAEQVGENRVRLLNSQAPFVYGDVVTVEETPTVLVVVNNGPEF